MCIQLHHIAHVSPYTYAYKVIKNVPIVQASTAYDKPKPGDTTIHILNREICMDKQMQHTLVNPNHISSYGITVQDNPLSNAPILISTEDHEFSLPLVRKVTLLGVDTRTPTDGELHTLPHTILLSEHELDPQNVYPPKASLTLEEDISRTVGYVKAQGKYFDFVGKYDNDPENQSLYKIVTLPQRFIASVNV